MTAVDCVPAGSTPEFGNSRVQASVVICTHNPRAGLLDRTLAALTQQTAPKHLWELIVVDNASTESISNRYPIDWHPGGRHVHEPQLGLTNARIRGLEEANAPLLIFVDDDNVLAPDYVQNALAIERKYPFLGVWGGGSTPEFESEPPAWTRDYWPILALRDVDTVRWSNTFDDWRAQPCGAGMCIRRATMERYRDRVSADQLLAGLDRKGTSLMSAGDTDIVYSARDLGLGFGTFPQLQLTHLIGAQRTTKGYLLRLVEGIAVSNMIIADRHGRDSEQTGWVKSLLRCGVVALLKGPRAAEFYLARKRGARAGKRLLLSSHKAQAS